MQPFEKRMKSRAPFPKFLCTRSNNHETCILSFFYRSAFVELKISTSSQRFSLFVAFSGLIKSRLSFICIDNSLNVTLESSFAGLYRRAPRSRGVRIAPRSSLLLLLPLPPPRIRRLLGPLFYSLGYEPGQSQVLPRQEAAGQGRAGRQGGAGASGREGRRREGGGGRGEGRGAQGGRV